MDPYTTILDNKEHPGDILEMKETIKRYFDYTERKEIDECKQLFT